MAPATSSAPDGDKHPFVISHRAISWRFLEFSLGVSLGFLGRLNDLGGLTFSGKFSWQTEHKQQAVQWVGKRNR